MGFLLTGFPLPHAECCSGRRSRLTLRAQFPPIPCCVFRGQTGCSSLLLSSSFFFRERCVAWKVIDDAFGASVFVFREAFCVVGIIGVPAAPDPSLCLQYHSCVRQHSLAARWPEQYGHPDTPNTISVELSRTQGQRRWMWRKEEPRMKLQQD